MASPKEIVGPMNMGNPREFTIGELAESIIRQVGSQSKLVMMPLPQDDPKQRQPDITVAKNTLNWQPKIELEEGLARTIAYFRQLL